LKKEKQIDSIVPYFFNIKEKIIENIELANTSIIIAVAWFTNKEIKQSLLTRKLANPSVKIEIVVDDNHINRDYFYDTKEEFFKTGIKIKDKVYKKFLHDKFVVIDNFITITGSFNFSKKAEKNSENIVIIKSKKISDSYIRKFRFLTIEGYMDRNIKLLFKYPEFTRQLLSTYYDFSLKEFRKYQPKIDLGYCYTAENGLYDELHYSSGFLFNDKINYWSDKLFEEFELPIKKKMIKEWTESRNEGLILDYYQDKEELYKYINDDLDKNRVGIENYYRRKLESVSFPYNRTV